MKKRLLAAVLALAMGATLFTGCNSSVADKSESISAIPTDNKYGLRENVEDGAILQCFSWSFKTIEESLEDIAMAGYSAIQTSPINACYDGGNAGMDLYGEGKWYYHYQPTDWKIGNYQLGTREEFMSLCTKAETYGIKVIVDVAPNHTTPTVDAISQDLINAVGGMENLYHSNGLVDIKDYKDRAQCTLQAMGGLNDVNTENPDFQDYFIVFLNDCIACGADGFRYDTAKHIGLADDPQDDPTLPNNFWNRVTTEVDKAEELFMYGEALQDGGERLADYIDVIGATTASIYGQRVRDSFKASFISAASVTDLQIGSAAPNVVTWVESHDNYINDGTADLDNEIVKLAYAFIVSRAEGTPLFFSRPYGATASDIWGTFNKIGMAGDPIYKDPIVVAANRFRNATVGIPENIFNPEENNRVICVERGSKGLVMINVADEDYTFELETFLEEGEYVNRVDGETVFTVEKGKITGTVPAKGIIVLCNEGYVDFEKPASVKVADDTTTYILGDSLKVTLEAENAAKATYVIDNLSSLKDGDEEVLFKDGDVIELGADMEEGEFTKLTLRAENAEGRKTTMSYIFKKQGKIEAGTKVYFEKPDNWGDTINAYVYDETTNKTIEMNASWPGKKMTLEEDGTYSYTFEKEFAAPLIIFNDGKNQSNGALEPGDQVIANKVYTVH